MRYSVLCPLCENGEYLPITLDAMFHLTGDDYEVIFAADPKAQAAIALARTVAERSTIPWRIVIGSDRTCRNPKLNNLDKAWEFASGRWLIMADCNVLLPPDAFDRLCARWAADVGMVCSPPIGSRPGNFAAEVECAFLNTFEAKWQILADWLGHGFAQGKLMFGQKAQLEALGGIAAMDSEPAEDAAATKMVRRGGLRVRLVAKLFEQPLGHRSWRQVWQRQVRWAKLRRRTFPLWYAAEIVATPIPLIITVVFGHTILPLALLGGFYAGECVLAHVAGWYVSWRSPIAFLVRDAMYLGVWLSGWVGRSIQWAGQHYSTARHSGSDTF